MTQSGPKKKVANRLVAMSSAAVLAVYAAGYTRTRSAAHRLEAQAAGRMATAPGPPRSAAPLAEIPTASRVSPLVATSGSASSSQPPAASAMPRLVASEKPAPNATQVGEAALPSPAETPALSSTTPQTAAPVSPAPEQAAAAAEPKAEPVAVVPAPVPTPAPAPPAPAWKDGTYTGWGSSRHGDIQAAVVVQGGRIESATIAQCRTRYSCSVIDRLPPEVAERQSPEVDYVSGATQSANAFYYAVIDALSKAK